MLMAEIERTEHGDSGRARAWTLRAVRALHDPVWTADGYVSATWRPVSPVTGRLDAFQWQTPVAALPSDKGAAIEPSPFEEAMLAPRREAPARLPSEPAAEPEAAPIESSPVEPAPVAAQDTTQVAAQDNSPVVTVADEPALPAASAPPPAIEPPVAAPLFRARQDLPKGDLSKVTPSSIPAVIPILRAPDDPGVDDEGGRDEFAEQIGPPRAQAGGWRGFLSRWGA
jgi:HemY protein